MKLPVIEYSCDNEPWIIEYLKMQNLSNCIFTNIKDLANCVAWDAKSDNHKAVKRTNVSMTTWESVDMSRMSVDSRTGQRGDRTGQSGDTFHGWVGMQMGTKTALNLGENVVCLDLRMYTHQII